MITTSRTRTTPTTRTTSPNVPDICQFFVQDKKRGKKSFFYSSNINDNSCRIFHKLFDASQKCDTFASIDKAVVVGKGQIHHRSNFNHIFAASSNHDGTLQKTNKLFQWCFFPNKKKQRCKVNHLVDSVHSKNRRLRRINDRSSHQRSKDPLKLKVKRKGDKNKCDLLPPLLMVKVPPAMSSSSIKLSRALTDNAAMSRSMSAKDFLSASRITLNGKWKNKNEIVSCILPAPPIPWGKPLRRKRRRSCETPRLRRRWHRSLQATRAKQ